MYIKKTILLLLLLINMVLIAYILVDNRLIFASNQDTESFFSLDLEPAFDLEETRRAVPEPVEKEGWLTYEATAYCLFGITRTGVWVQRGIVATDPREVPMGSILEIEAGDYSGIYTAMDTGMEIQGRRIDIYVPTGEEAIRFGRQQIRLRIIRRGWDPAVP